jgi:ABC-type sugar transport system ATPase subunit
VALVYISHRLEEVPRIADRMTVLHDGRRVVTTPAHGLELPQVIRWMVGRELDAAACGTTAPGCESAHKHSRGRLCHTAPVPGAVVVGGTSLMGGRGSVVNSFFGALIIAVLETGLTQMGVQEPAKRLIRGAVIVTKGDRGLLPGPAGREAVRDRDRSLDCGFDRQECLSYHKRRKA